MLYMHTELIIDSEVRDDEMDSNRSHELLASSDLTTWEFSWTGSEWRE